MAKKKQLIQTHQLFTYNFSSFPPLLKATQWGMALQSKSDPHSRLATQTHTVWNCTSVSDPPLSHSSVANLQATLHSSMKRRLCIARGRGDWTSSNYNCSFWGCGLNLRIWWRGGKRPRVKLLCCRGWTLCRLGCLFLHLDWRSRRGCTGTRGWNRCRRGLAGRTMGLLVISIFTP